MKNNGLSSANNFLDTIKEIIRQELESKDNTILCQVVSINDNGSVNVYVEPDEKNVVRNIPNNTSIELQTGDFVYVYKINNQLSNSFVLNKVGQTVKGLQQEKQGDGVSNEELEFLLSKKQDVLIPGDNIIIKDNVISSFGGQGVFDYNELKNKPIINLSEPYTSVPSQSLTRILYLMNSNGLASGTYNLVLDNGEKTFLINYTVEDHTAVIYGSEGFSKYELKGATFQKTEDLYQKLNQDSTLDEEEIKQLLF